MSFPKTHLTNERDERLNILLSFKSPEELEDETEYFKQQSSDRLVLYNVPGAGPTGSEAGNTDVSSVMCPPGGPKADISWGLELPPRVPASSLNASGSHCGSTIIACGRYHHWLLLLRREEQFERGQGVLLSEKEYCDVNWL